MRRTLLALTLLVGLLVFPSSASATHDLLDFESATDAMLAVDPTLDPPPDDPTKDFAVGGFQSFFGTFGFSAHRDGPKAEDAWGYMTVEGQPDRNRVVCLAVLGNKAALGLVNQFSSTFITSTMIVRDSGLPGGTGDTFAFAGIPPEECELGLFAEPPIVFLAERGNILVHDAQP